MARGEESKRSTIQGQESVLAYYAKVQDGDGLVLGNGVGGESEARAQNAVSFLGQAIIRVKAAALFSLLSGLKGYLPRLCVLLISLFVSS